MFHYIVYDYLDRPCYEGDFNQCRSWIFSHCDIIINRHCIYRTWEENGYTYFDVGKVFHIGTIGNHRYYEAEPTVQ